MSSLHLELVGPFHVLQGQLTGVPWQQCVLQDFYFYDPPKLVTVLLSDDEVDYFRLGAGIVGEPCSLIAHEKCHSII